MDREFLQVRARLRPPAGYVALGVDPTGLHVRRSKVPQAGMVISEPGRGRISAGEHADPGKCANRSLTHSAVRPALRASPDLDCR